MGRLIALAVVIVGKLIALAVVIAIVLGISLGIPCLFAWAITSIWPTLPFWPVALGAWALAFLFSCSSSK